MACLINILRGKFVYGNERMSVPSISASHACNFYYEIKWTADAGYTFNKINTVTRINIPITIDMYTNESLLNFANAYKVGDTATIINIVSSINNKIDDTNNAINDVKNSVDETNKFLKDTNTTDSDFEFSHDNSTNDITKSGLETLFTQLYNVFNDSTDKDLVIPLPFVSQNITIESNFFRNLLTKYHFNFILTLADMVWLYLISRFIITDITKYIDKMKNGKILTSTDTNITTEVL